MVLFVRLNRWRFRKANGIPIKSKFELQYTLEEISSIQHGFARDTASYYLENIKGIYASKASGLWAVPIIIITRLVDGGLYGER